MNDNVIKFQRREPPKPPRQTPPWLKRALVIAGAVAAFLLAFAYFYITGDQAAWFAGSAGAN